MQLFQLLTQTLAVEFNRTWLGGEFLYLSVIQTPNRLSCQHTRERIEKTILNCEVGNIVGKCPKGMLETVNKE